jgi:hypothetical protein
VKELAVQPAVICAQDKPFPIAGARTAVSAATDRNRAAIISRCSLLLIFLLQNEGRDPASKDWAF